MPTSHARTRTGFTLLEVVIALGPGNSLGGPLARILVSEGWGGIQSRADLDARHPVDRLQNSPAPPLGHLAQLYEPSEDLQ